MPSSNSFSKEELIKNLESNDSGVRNNAILALGELNDAGVIEHIEKLCNAGDPATRYFAKKTLKKLKELRQKNDPVALDAEPEYGSNIEILKKELFSPNTEIRLRALKSVFVNCYPALVPALVEMLNAETDAYVLATLVKVVGKHGGAEHIDVLKKYLSHDDLRVRANAIEGLEFIGTEKIIPYIVPFINDIDNRIRANAVKTLSKFKSGEMIAVLGSMIDSQQPWMRDSAIFALTQIASEEAITFIAKALYDNDKNISNHAMQALLKIGNEFALKKLDEFRQKTKSRPSSGNLYKKHHSVSDSAIASSKVEKRPEAVHPSEARMHAQANKNEPAPDEMPSMEELEDAVAAEKFKAGGGKKELALINIFKDEQSVVASSFKIDLDDNFASYVHDIAYISLSTLEKKKAVEKREPQDAKTNNDAKKKITPDSLKNEKK